MKGKYMNKKTNITIISKDHPSPIFKDYDMLNPQYTFNLEPINSSESMLVIGVKDKTYELIIKIPTFLGFDILRWYNETQYFLNRLVSENDILSITFDNVYKSPAQIEISNSLSIPWGYSSNSYTSNCGAFTLHMNKELIYEKINVSWKYGLSDFPQYKK